jgi:hypothetical protein
VSGGDAGLGSLDRRLLEGHLNQPGRVERRRDRAMVYRRRTLELAKAKAILLSIAKVLTLPA